MKHITPRTGSRQWQSKRVWTRIWRRKLQVEMLNAIAKLEASYQHLATKADIEKLRADLTWRIVLAMSVLTAIFVAIVRLPLSA